MNVIITHEPVLEMKEISKDTAIFTLDDGRKYKIKFSVQGNKVIRKIYFSATVFIDELDFMDNIDSAAQWTVDNFEEILYLEEMNNEYA